MREFFNHNDVWQFAEKYPQSFSAGFPSEFACGKGWTKILDDMFSSIENTLAQSVNGAAFQIEYVKEKFGSLRVYAHTNVDAIPEILAEAQSRSAKVCEGCGCESKIEEHAGWYTTYCESCRKKLFSIFDD